jgi:uncharacterized membrane protein (UPF0127 family)
VLVDASTGGILARKVRWARSPLERMRGLLGRRDEEAALVIEPARQVHSFGMKKPIDVIFCTEDWYVLHVVHRMKPGRVTKWVTGAKVAIELPEGAAHDVDPGSRILVRE